MHNKLRLLRKNKNWTQGQAAKIIGIQQSYLSKLENGLFQPSKEVIEKIALAYDIDATQLTSAEDVVLPKRPALKNGRLLIFGILALFLSVLLFAAAYLNLFFNELYYTYQSNPIEQVETSHQLVPRILIMDEYKGESFVQLFEAKAWKFDLIAQRKVSRIENRWLYFVSLVLVLLAMFWGFKARKK